MLCCTIEGAAARAVVLGLLIASRDGPGCIPVSWVEQEANRLQREHKGNPVIMKELLSS